MPEGIVSPANAKGRLSAWAFAFNKGQICQILRANSQLTFAHHFLLTIYYSQALMQLLCNPFIGSLTLKIGYKYPLLLGNIVLFLCSLRKSSATCTF